MKDIRFIEMEISEEKDFLNMKYEQTITDFLSKEGILYLSFPISLLEIIVFSSEVYKDVFLFFKKSNILMVTNSHVYIIDTKRKYIKKKSKIQDLLGFTQSLILT